MRLRTLFSEWKYSVEDEFVQSCEESGNYEGSPLLTPEMRKQFPKKEILIIDIKIKDIIKTSKKNLRKTIIFQQEDETKGTIICSSEERNSIKEGYNLDFIPHPYRVGRAFVSKISDTLY